MKAGASWILFGCLIVALRLANIASAGCFTAFPSPPTVSDRVTYTNGLFTWDHRIFLATLFVTASGQPCDDGTPHTNFVATATNGIVDCFVFVSPQTIPESGGLQIVDATFSLTVPAPAEGAAMDIALDGVTNSYTTTFPELINVRVASVTTSNVCLCWNSRSNTVYQIQTNSDLTTGNWDNFGDSVSGLATNTCATNLLDGVQQFYRIQTVP